MTDPIVLAAGILGAAVVLAVAVYASARVRIEQQRTLQALIVRGGDLPPHWGMHATPEQRDRRLGLLLVGVGLAWSLGTLFVGGKAWMLGAIPVTLGAVFLLLWALDARAR